MSVVPAQWLRKLLPTNHVEHFPLSWSVRFSLGMAIVLVTGAALGKMDLAVYAAIGMLLNSATQHPVAGRVNIAQMAIAVPLAIFGHFVGVFAYGPTWRHVLVLAVLAAISAIISSFGAAYSIGSIQMMVLAIISSAIPNKEAWWVPVALYLAGTALAALLLLIDMAFRKDNPERNAYANLLHVLATYMQKKAQGQVDDEERQKVLQAQQDAYTNLLQNRISSPGESATTDGRAAALGIAAALRNRVFAGNNSSTELAVGAKWLNRIADAFVHNQSQPRPPQGSGVLLEDINAVATSLWGSESNKALVGLYVRAHPAGSLRVRLGRMFDVGASAWRDAIRLALCIGVAVWIASVLDTHSFWIPLMVVTIMKPDFGSVFQRALQRSIGTVIGAGLGTVLLWAVPAKGIWMALLIAAIAFFVPWGASRGFWVMTIFITTLVVPMVSWMTNKPAGILAWDRILDTLIAGALALFFGYLLWPTTYKTQVKKKVNQQLSVIETLFRAVVLPDLSQSGPQRLVARSRAAAYRGLSDLHIQLQRALAEPRPISQYEAAWFPIVASLGRICDILTGYSLARMQDPTIAPPPAAKVQAQLQMLESLEKKDVGDGADSSETIKYLRREIGHLIEIMKHDEATS